MTRKHRVCIRWIWAALGVSAAVSGLLTGVAAGSATAGHLWAMRWNPPTGPNDRRLFAVIQRLRAVGIDPSGL